MHVLPVSKPSTLTSLSLRHFQSRIHEAIKLEYIAQSKFSPLLTPEGRVNNPGIIKMLLTYLGKFKKNV
jgi:hypothetical protein